MRSLQITSLQFAVRPGVLCKYGGQLLLVFAVLTGVTFLVSVIVGEYNLSWTYGAIILSCGLAGYLLQRVEAPLSLQDNEALVLSAVIFIFTPLVSSLAFLQSGLSPVDAIFEAVSGITTTGLSTLPTVENAPRTFLFSRAWLQWIGGLGIVVLSVALLLPQSQAAIRLFSGNWQKEDIITSVKKYARAVLLVYLILTVIGILVLYLLGASWLNAVTHILAAVSTGGFSTFDGSLAGFHTWYMQATVIAFCFLGAISLGLYYQVFQKNPRLFLTNTEVIALVCAAAGASFLLAIFLYFVDGFSFRQILQFGPMLAVSAQTTAGFSPVDVAALSPGSKLLIILMMAVGGNVGSTAGGIKIMRLLIIFKTLRLFVIRSGMPSGAVVQTRYMGKRLEPEEVERCFLLASLFVAIIICSWLPFVIMGYPPLDALFEVVSACGTVGLSTGISAAGLPALLKAILCLDMLMGRLEIFAILVLLYPSTWYGKSRSRN